MKMNAMGECDCFGDKDYIGKGLNAVQEDWISWHNNRAHILKIIGSWNEIFSWSIEFSLFYNHIGPWIAKGKKI